MPLAKAKILVEATGNQFEVMFNPEEYTINKDNNFASQNVPGLSGPILQFVHGNMRTLEMELFFDTYEAHTDVRDQIANLLDLLKINGDLHAPPIIQISWASLQFRCVLARASQKFILFLPDGRPARARISCTFNEYIDPEREAKEVNRQTSTYTKAHIVIAGETLSAIAAAIYGDPAQWRPIAIVNEVDDPRELTAGQSLQIPPLPFIDPETGEVLA
ncbi:MAG: LysM peptidoglycan-binding domain-containing protein [Terracidiphilus sp.]